MNMDPRDLYLVTGAGIVVVGNLLAWFFTAMEKRARARRGMKSGINAPASHPEATAPS